MSPRRAAGRIAVLWLLVAACTPEPSGPPKRDCRALIWAQASSSASELSVVGSWDDWSTPGLTLEARDDGWSVAALELPPGEYGYLLVEGGEGRLDEHNPLTTFRLSDWLEVSLLEVPSCEQPAIEIERLDQGSAAAALSIEARFWASSAGDPLDPSTVEAGGLSLVEASTDEGILALATEGLPRGRHGFEIRARDRAGREAEPAHLSVFVDPIAPTWRDAIVYQVVIDRFRGDGGAWLEAPETPASRAGGTLEGVQAALDEGWFESLGVSALWLSPVYQNPGGEPRLGTDGRLYSDYHGYWVADTRAVDDRLGGEPALEALLDRAHAEGLAVILDVVPNHVDETHPIFAQHLADGWFNEHESVCVCGTPSCPWGEFQQTCWFAPYLPDIRLEHPDAMNFAIGELAWWLERYQIDGVRIDAVPMMPRAASRRIAHLLRTHSFPGDDRLLLGEVFTGSGSEGIAGLRYYLGPDGLDSVFDFPLMWAVREALGDPSSAGFVEIEAILDETDAALEGSGAVLGRMLGNHDTARFVSALVGDHLGDPWDEPASQPQEGAAIELAAVGLSLQLTLPGMPVIYQGDELGLAGADDPDNRRVMPDPATLSAARLGLLEHARTLGRLRRCSPALRSDLRETLHVGADTYAYARLGPDGELAVVALSRAEGVREIAIPSGVVEPGSYVDALSGAQVELASGAIIELSPRSSMVLLADGDPCALLGPGEAKPGRLPRGRTTR